MEASSARAGRQAASAFLLTDLRRAAVRPHAVLLAFTGAWALASALMAYVSYRGFLTGRFDLGNMTQAVWSTLQGRPLEATEVGGEQITRLGTHVDALLLFFAPLWAVWPSPVMLVCVQAVVLATGALPVFWLARKHLASERGALLLAAAYLLNPTVQWQVFNDFHPTTIAIPLLLFAIWYLDEDRLWAFGVFAALAVLSQEQMGFLVGGLGLWHLIRRRRPVSGTAIALVATAWSIFAFAVVIPHFGGDSSPYASRYAGVGGSPLEIIETAFAHPLRLLSEMGTLSDLRHLVSLAFPLAGLFARCPGLVLVATPQAAMSFLSERPSDLQVDGHVNSPLVAILVPATVFGIARLKRKAEWSSIVLFMAALAALLVGPMSFAVTPLASVLLLIAVLFLLPISRNAKALACCVVAGMTAVMVASNPPSLITSGLFTAARDPKVAAADEALALIPPDAAVSATNKLGSHLSARRYVYWFPLEGRATWVVVDTEDDVLHTVAVHGGRRYPGFTVPAMEAFRRPNVMADRVTELRANPSWELVFERETILVFRKAQQASAAT